MKTQLNKITKLDDLKDFEPVELPCIVIAGGDLRPCNVTAYGIFLERVEQARPDRADSFIKGEDMTTGNYMTELVSYVPIQFYKRKN